MSHYIPSPSSSPPVTTDVVFASLSLIKSISTNAIANKATGKTLSGFIMLIIKNPIIRYGTFSFFTITFNNSASPSPGKSPPAISNPCETNSGNELTNFDNTFCNAYVLKNATTA